MARCVAKLATPKIIIFMVTFCFNTVLTTCFFPIQTWDNLPQQSSFFFKSPANNFILWRCFFFRVLSTFSPQKNTTPTGRSAIFLHGAHRACARWELWCHPTTGRLDGYPNGAAAGWHELSKKKQGAKRTGFTSRGGSQKKGSMDMLVPWRVSFFCFPALISCKSKFRLLTRQNWRKSPDFSEFTQKFSDRFTGGFRIRKSSQNGLIYHKKIAPSKNRASDGFGHLGRAKNGPFLRHKYPHWS